MSDQEIEQMAKRITDKVMPDEEIKRMAKRIADRAIPTWSIVVFGLLNGLLTALLVYLVQHR